MREIILPRLESWQKDVYDAMENSRGSRKRFVVKAKRQVGKSILAIVQLIKFALEGKCTSVLIEPTRAQSLRVMKQLCDMLDGSGVLTSINQSTLIITFCNGSEILFKSAEQREALRGFTCSGLMVIDEAAFITDDIFYVLYPVVDACGAPILVISTPLFADGEYYRLFTSKTPLIESFDWSQYDTSKFLPQETLEMYRQQLSETKFQSEYLGQFILDGGYVFQNYTQCIGKSNKEPVVGGIDWGSGQNGDFTVLTLMDEDKKVTDIVAFNNLSPNEQINKLVQVINSHRLKSVLVETNSIGQVYYDLLRRQVTTPIEGFTTTNDSKRQIIEQLVTAFNNKTITIIDDAELLKQISHYAMEKTSKGYTYNGISGYHDDYVISLALAFNKANNTNQYCLTFL